MASNYVQARLARIQTACVRHDFNLKIVITGLSFKTAQKKTTDCISSCGATLIVEPLVAIDGKPSDRRYTSRLQSDVAMRITTLLLANKNGIKAVGI